MIYKDYYYILFIILVLLLIFIKYNKKEKIREGINWDPLNVGGKMKKAGDKMKSEFEKPFNDFKDRVTGTFTRFGNDVVKGTGDIFGKITQIFNQIGDIFGKIASFGKRFKDFGEGLRDIFSGIGNEVKYSFIGVARGFENIGLLIAYTGSFVFSYVMCGVKFLSNLPNCIMYYIVDAFFRILYLPIRITLWVLYTFLNINLYPTEKQLWDFAGWVDSKIYTVAGFNVLRWPKNVRDQCYNCKRLKTSVLIRKSKDIDYDFKYGIAELLQKGIDEIKQGGNKIKGAFLDGW